MSNNSIILLGIVKPDNTIRIEMNNRKGTLNLSTGQGELRSEHNCISVPQKLITRITDFEIAPAELNRIKAALRL